MRNAAKKATVALVIFGALAVAALSVPGLVRTREVADVNIASAPQPLATTAPILMQEPTPLPTVTALPVATFAPLAPAVEPTAATEAAPTPTPLPEPTEAATPTATAVPLPSPEPVAPTSTATPTAVSGSAARTESPTAAPTATPTLESTPTPTTEPTAAPTAEPTPSPTTPPTAVPVVEPTATATTAPTAVPTPSPTPTEPAASVNTGTAIASGWMYVTSDDGLILRSDPAGAPLSALEYGYQVHATGRVSFVDGRTWMEVDIPANGWMALEFLSDTKPPAAVVPTVVVTGEAPTAEDWAKLRHCESSGNYNIVDGTGLYHGAYQFNVGTWDGLAATFRPDLVGVLPSQAAPADQDAMALELYARRGAQPWPHCGRFLL